MIAIHKYKLSLAVHQTVEMPYNSELLKVAFVGDDLYLWAWVDTSLKGSVRTIRIIGTGQEIDGDYDHYHIDTVFNKDFVWHVFEAVKQH